MFGGRWRLDGELFGISSHLSTKMGLTGDAMGKFEKMKYEKYGNLGEFENLKDRLVLCLFANS